MHVRYVKLPTTSPAPGVSADVSPVTRTWNESPTGSEGHARGPVRPVPVVVGGCEERRLSTGPMPHGPHAPKYLALGSDWTPMNSPCFPLTDMTVFLPVAGQTPVSR